MGRDKYHQLPFFPAREKEKGTLLYCTVLIHTLFFSFLLSINKLKDSLFLFYFFSLFPSTDQLIDKLID